MISTGWRVSKSASYLLLVLQIVDDRRNCYYFFVILCAKVSKPGLHQQDMRASQSFLAIMMVLNRDAESEQCMNVLLAIYGIDECQRCSKCISAVFMWGFVNLLVCAHCSSFNWIHLIVDTFHSHVNCFSFCSSSTDWIFIHRIAVQESLETNQTRKKGIHLNLNSGEYVDSSCPMLVSNDWKVNTVQFSGT